jgi:uncharacterized membrane protein
MSETINKSLEKEFELERMILFSDAVFAIAITLLILEIKFPELPANYSSINLFIFLKPILIHFFAFVVSFFFIGMSWARHLALCKFLKQYNHTVIFFNLLLLFFIVTFPFSISAFIENVNTAIAVAILVYVSNIFLVMFAQFLFVHYILKKNTSLSIAGYKEEKEYFYLKAKYSFIMMMVTMLVMIATIIMNKANANTLVIPFSLLPVFALIMKRRLRKHKPKTQLLTA